MKTSLALIAALGLALPTVPAVAKSGAVSVDYSDLDLSTEKGQEQLERRIDKAARAFCGADQPKTGTMLRGGKTRSCITSIKREIRTKVSAVVEQQS